ncbi:hypothetical protein M8Z33_34125 [Streptomyces sp. ZAF1911]|uniref:hypothetical protein n=1 Tax=Streptomyces sp. ZAF1911 TaxID=2944129 RepID=UPI00237BB589|nr:hypothetical protein [Streptomyces sp. ZAF1911]MDD9381599.1 hypothetical protein [Streptomyces sp. ZAF1911]
MPHSPAPMRALRAALFAAVAVALGATGHSYMSGTDLPALGLLSAFGLTGGLAWLSAGRRRGPLAIAAALLAVQAVLHLLFSASAGGRHQAGGGGGSGDGMDMGAGMSTGMGGAAADAVHGVHSMAGMHSMDGMAGMAGTDGMSAMDGMTAMAGMGDMAAGHAHDGLGMIAAHVLAGLFCALWLAWGEAAVFRLTAVLGAGALLAARPLSRVLALLRARGIPVPPAPSFRPAGYRRPRTLCGAVHAHTAERRGPPARGRIRITAPGRPACA